MQLNPDWVVGFVDGEGCFFVGIQRNPAVKIGFQVIPELRVVQHYRDVDVLYGLKTFFGFGLRQRWLCWMGRTCCFSVGLKRRLAW